MKMRIIKFLIFAGLFWGSISVLPLFSKLTIKKTVAPLRTLSRQEQSLTVCTTLESGFGEAESWGVWTTEKESVISLVLPEQPKDLSLNFKAQAFGKIKYVDVFYESQRIGHWPILKHSPENYILDCSKLPRGRRIKLTLKNNELSRPCDLIKGNADNRTLGIGLCSLRIIDK